MKRLSCVAIILIVLAAISATAVPNPSTAKVPAFPGILTNARYVYVASYEGDQFDSRRLHHESTVYFLATERSVAEAQESRSTFLAGVDKRHTQRPQ